MTQKNDSVEFLPANRNAIRSQEGIVADSNTYKVQFNLIRANLNFNAREQYEGIEELADNIAEIGLLTPLLGIFVVVDGVSMFDLTDGFRRYKAIELLVSKGVEVGEIPCRLKPMSIEDRLISMFVTQDNKKLTDVEIANIFRRLVNLGFKPQDIKKKVSKSITYVNDMLLLSEQTTSVKEAVASKKASATAVIAAAKEIGPDATKKKVDESIANNEKFTVEKAKDIKEEVNTIKRINTSKLDFESPKEYVMPHTLEEMIIQRDRLLKLDNRSHKQVKFLNELIDKIKIREDLDSTTTRTVKKELNFTDAFDTILWTKFCSIYCGKIGKETCEDIFNFFKTETANQD
jgi:ParB-like chromosome segregation protein Spo0J